MRFVQCTRRNPCPICESAHWCSVASDGTVANCRRSGHGGDEKRDQAGGIYYVHRLAGERAKRRPQIEFPRQKSKIADPDTLDRVYQALLANMPLTAAHGEHLSRRGLAELEIVRRRYGSMMKTQRGSVARELAQRFGEVTLLRVPGFVAVPDERGAGFLSLVGWSGLMVPVRDVYGKIVAVKIRNDDPKADNKYTSLSSRSRGGPSPGAQVHVPAGVGDRETLGGAVRVTEGELKADVAFSISGVPTVSIPGVGMWRLAAPVLQGMGCRTVRLALDSDAASNRDVARALADMAEFLDCEGYRVEVERWDPRHKGIDDALALCAEVEVLAGNAAMGWIDHVVESSGCVRETDE